MLFRVNAASDISLADQVAAQVRGAIIDGSLAPGDRLPPARQVAAGLDINMHTVLRGYQQLRDEGLVDLRRGRGATVADHVQPAAMSLARDIRDLAARALAVGWSAQDLGAAVAAAAQQLMGAGAEPTSPTGKPR